MILLYPRVAIAQVIPTEVEGSSGGGLTPWALAAPKSPNVSITNVNTQDFHIRSIALSAAPIKRLEVSLATQLVDAPTVGSALNLSQRIDMTTVGLKWKLFEGAKNAPAIAFGMQIKHVTGAIPDALEAMGAIGGESGIDYYLAATDAVRLFGRPVILSGTLRATKANQFGLLGFGGGRFGNDNYHIVPEASAGMFVATKLAIGVEYRAKPNNISLTVFSIQENAATDIFVSFFPTKRTAITAAYADLGQIGPSRSAVPAIANRQSGFYIQAQTDLQR